MSPIEVFDVLNRGNFTWLECRDGSKFGGITLNVNYCADLPVEPACLEVKPEGLVLHFNSRDQWGSMSGHSIWLSDIVTVG
jgi:hypothetical protein